jgi:hypothetical protein
MCIFHGGRWVKIREPVMRVCNDNGATFGPVLRLAANGTLGEAAEESEEE